MRDHYVSPCLCLYNSTLGRPGECIHSNFSDVDNIFAYIFGNASLDLQNADAVAAASDEIVECVTPCVGRCFRRCGSWFLEAIDPALNNGSAYRSWRNQTFTYDPPESLVDWNSSGVVRLGTWTA